MLHFSIKGGAGEGERTPCGFVSKEGYFVDLPELSDNDLFRIESIAREYEVTERTISDVMESYDRELKLHKKLALSQSEKETYSRVLSALTDSALGPIEFLLGDGDIEEILVNGIGEPIHVFHRRLGMLKTNLAFESGEYFIEVANRALRLLGRRVDEQNLRAHGMLPNHDRISVAIPPYSKNHSLAIRRFMVNPFTVPDLIRAGMLTSRQAACLWLLFESGGANIGIVGNTGAGKTTLLNSLLRFVPKKARIVCVEETPEIRPTQEQVVQLISNERLTLKDAIADTLRLRPDRVVIGEVRSDGEAKALVESCLSGQALGTYFTYHANSAAFALKRLRGQGVREDDLEAIDIIVVCKRDEEKGRVTRKVVEIFDRAGEPSGRIRELEKKTGVSVKKRKKFLESFSGDDAEFSGKVEEIAG